MKRIILSTMVVLFAFGTVQLNAKEIINPTESIEVYDVNALCKLILEGDYNAVKTMVDKGEDVNKKSKGMTPLMYAAKYNKAKIAELLIKNGAKLDARSRKEKITALEFAKRSKALDAFKVIRNAMHQ